MMYCCKYYGVGFFVFARMYDAGHWEPIIEVDDERQGLEMIRWLTLNYFVALQLLKFANDNTGLQKMA